MTVVGDEPWATADDAPVASTGTGPSPTTDGTFAAFYADVWPSSVTLAALLTQCSGAAEDLAQDALARVYRQWVRVQDESPRAYLRIAIVNACNNWHRHNKVEVAKLPQLITLTTAAQPDHLADAIAALPYRQRTVLVLRYYEGCSETEIAAYLRCRPGTVKSLSSRALTQLRKVIQP